MASNETQEESHGDGLFTLTRDLIGDPIENTLQFFHWFSSIEEEMERGQEDIYRSETILNLSKSLSLSLSLGLSLFLMK